MISKEILFFSACLYLALALVDLEKLENRPKCRSKTILCPCMNKNGLRLNVTAKTCLGAYLIGKKSVCKGEAIVAKCKRGEVVNFHYIWLAIAQFLRSIVIRVDLKGSIV